MKVMDAEPAQAKLLELLLGSGIWTAALGGRATDFESFSGEKASGEFSSTKSFRQR